MGNKGRNPPTPKAGGHEPTARGPGSAAIELEDIGDHIEKLRQVTTATHKLVDLLGSQLQGLSMTVPVFRGLEIVKELRERSKGCRESIQDVFEPLRAYIEHEKAGFYAKNSEAIEEMIRKRVEEGVKRKLPVVLKERLGRYEEFLRTNSTLTDKVEQEMVTTSARAANSLLSVKHPNEQIVLIPSNPDWDGITLEDLKNIEGPVVSRLAVDQGLTPLEDSPDSELARVHNLNLILRHLGVHYRAVPSWNGILLTSASRKTHL